MILILYISVALIAVAFLVLVIFVSKTMKSLQTTLENVSETIGGLEKQIEGVTTETAALLHKSNQLADDLQKKAEKLNSVVIAVKDVGETVGHFNHTLQSFTKTVDKQVEDNKERISQVVQWSNVFLELRDKWKIRKRNKEITVKTDSNHEEHQKERARS